MIRGYFLLFDAFQRELKYIEICSYRDNCFTTEPFSPRVYKKILISPGNNAFLKIWGNFTGNDVVTLGFPDCFTFSSLN